MKKYFFVLICAALFTVPSVSLYAQSDVDETKLKEISRQISELKLQQQQIFEGQKQILNGIEEIKKTVNRIRGM